MEAEQDFNSIAYLKRVPEEKGFMIDGCLLVSAAKLNRIQSEMNRRGEEEGKERKRDSDLIRRECFCCVCV